MTVESQRYTEIEHQAFERYLLELVREFGKEQDRLGGWPIQILEVELSGAYPDTVLRLRRSDDQWHVAGIWRNPIHWDKDDKPRTSPVDMATWN